MIAEGMERMTGGYGAKTTVATCRLGPWYIFLKCLYIYD